MSFLLRAKFPQFKETSILEPLAEYEVKCTLLRLTVWPLMYINDLSIVFGMHLIADNKIQGGVPKLR